MSLYIMQGAIEEGFIYAFVALGLFVSYRILNIADLTTDGTFALGSVVTAVVTNAGYPLLSIPIVLAAGAAAGLVTAFLQTKMKVPSILAGIITMTALHSINLLILGGSPSIYFSKQDTVYTLAESIFGKSAGKLMLLILLTALVGIALILFFRTNLGLSIRATGDNPDMVRASSINPAFTTTIGLAISNALVALGGALLAQSFTLGDVNVGTGTVVIGLASLILGGSVFRGRKVWAGVCGAVVGTVIYRTVLTLALRNTTNPAYLKLISAVIVAVVICFPAASSSIQELLKRRKGGTNHADTH